MLVFAPFFFFLTLLLLLLVASPETVVAALPCLFYNLPQQCQVSPECCWAKPPDSCGILGDTPQTSSSGSSSASNMKSYSGQCGFPVYDKHAACVPTAALSSSSSSSSSSSGSCPTHAPIIPEFKTSVGFVMSIFVLALAGVVLLAYLTFLAFRHCTGKRSENDDDDDDGKGPSKFAIKMYLLQEKLALSMKSAKEGGDLNTLSSLWLFGSSVMGLLTVATLLNLATSNGNSHWVNDGDTGGDLSTGALCSPLMSFFHRDFLKSPGKYSSGPTYAQSGSSFYVYATVNATGSGAAACDGDDISSFKKVASDTITSLKMSGSPAPTCSGAGGNQCCAVYESDYNGMYYFTVVILVLSLLRAAIEITLQVRSSKNNPENLPAINSFVAYSTGSLVMYARWVTSANLDPPLFADMSVSLRLLKLGLNLLIDIPVPIVNLSMCMVYDAQSLASQWALVILFIVKLVTAVLEINDLIDTVRHTKEEIHSSDSVVDAVDAESLAGVESGGVQPSPAPMVQQQQQQQQHQQQLTISSGGSAPSAVAADAQQQQQLDDDDSNNMRIVRQMQEDAMRMQMAAAAASLYSHHHHHGFVHHHHHHNGFVHHHHHLHHHHHHHGFTHHHNHAAAGWHHYHHHHHHFHFHHQQNAMMNHTGAAAAEPQQLVSTPVATPPQRELTPREPQSPPPLPSPSAPPAAVNVMGPNVALLEEIRGLQIARVQEFFPQLQQVRAVSEAAVAVAAETVAEEAAQVVDRNMLIVQQMQQEADAQAAAAEAIAAAAHTPAAVDANNNNNNNMAVALEHVQEAHLQQQIAAPAAGMTIVSAPASPISAPPASDAANIITFILTPLAASSDDPTAAATAAAAASTSKSNNDDMSEDPQQQAMRLLREDGARAGCNDDDYDLLSPSAIDMALDAMLLPSSPVLRMTMSPSSVANTDRHIMQLFAKLGSRSSQRTRRTQYVIALMYVYLFAILILLQRSRSGGLLVTGGVMLVLFTIFGVPLSLVGQLQLKYGKPPPGAGLDYRPLLELHLVRFSLFLPIVFPFIGRVDVSKCIAASSRDYSVKPARYDGFCGLETPDSQLTKTCKGQCAGWFELQAHERDIVELKLGSHTMRLAVPKGSTHDQVAAEVATFLETFRAYRASGGVTTVPDQQQGISYYTPPMNMV